MDNNIQNNRRSRYEVAAATTNRTKSDCEDFSDDSLEGVSLPPPPPPPCVPPPPSLSAPVTPSKRGSIAWEISLDNCTEHAKKQSAGVADKSEKVRMR